MSGYPPNSAAAHFLKTVLDENQKVIMGAAAKVHWTLVWDLVHNWHKDLGVKFSGSLTGTHLGHVWDVFPSWVREQFPSIEDVAVAINKGVYHYGGPKQLTRDSKGELIYQLHTVDELSVETRAKDLYEYEADNNPKIHSNRFAPWRELDRQTKDIYREKVRAERK